MSDKEHLLFVCTANQQRSPTAEEMFSDDDRYEARSCGTHATVHRRCDEEIIDWADVIFCMEEMHRRELLDRFPAAENKEIVVLGCHMGSDHRKSLLGNGIRQNRGAYMALERLVPP
jgi:predicted protein tyrosine phosphatase